MKNVRFIGLDVHADTIAVAVTERDGEGAVDRRDSEPPRVDREAGEEARFLGAGSQFHET